jgi:hypothetical protein
VLELDLLDFSTALAIASFAITILGSCLAQPQGSYHQQTRNMDLEDSDLQHQIYRMPLHLYSVNEHEPAHIDMERVTSNTLDCHAKFMSVNEAVAAVNRFATN